MYMTAKSSFSSHSIWARSRKWLKYAITFSILSCFNAARCQTLRHRAHPEYRQRAAAVKDFDLSLVTSLRFP